MPKAPVTTSNLTWRLGSPAPAGPITCTVAVAVSPEQSALVPHAVRSGTTVSVLNSGAGRTVTLDVAVCPTESWTVITTRVSAATFAGNSTIVAEPTACATGRTAELLENA